MHHMLLSLLIVAAGADEAPAPDIVVVCPAEFRGAMQLWTQRRTSQGHVVRFVSNEGEAETVRDRIRAAANEGRLHDVLLLGDAPAPNEPASAPRTATFRIPSKVNRFWGGDPDLASDNPYADLDGDGVPELAVGRIPAGSAAELAGILEKILEYEAYDDYGPWRTRINFVAGQPCYGAAADSILEAMASKLIASGIPATHASTMTYASWHSAFCPDPHRFHRCTLDRLNEG
jgi:hypothetical protein